MKQKIITNYLELNQWLKVNECKTILLVCDDSIGYMKSFNQYITAKVKEDIRIIQFREFRSNPQYESVVKGVEQFRQKGCDSIIAVGGGSAMDVAKCSKAYVNMDGRGENGGYLEQEIVPNSIPFLTIPTTAGTGSEATRYAVIYYDGKKQSVTSESFIPETVLMDPNSLTTLPMY